MQSHPVAAEPNHDIIVHHKMRCFVMLLLQAKEIGVKIGDDIDTKFNSTPTTLRVNLFHRCSSRSNDTIAL